MNVDSLTFARLKVTCLLAALAACDPHSGQPEDSGSDEQSASAGEAGSGQASPQSDGATSTANGDGGADGGGSAHDASPWGDDGGRGARDAGKPSHDAGTSCDRRKLTCRRAEPVCPEGQVAEIVGNCFGACVRIDQCACSEADACPQPEQYTCHRSAMHCGPYVN